MITNLDTYKDFIDSIMKRTPLLLTEQLKVMLFKYFEGKEEEVTPDIADMIIFACQRTGKLLLSSDGWAMTKTQYKRLILNRAEEHIDVGSTYRIPDMNSKCASYCPEIINLMWIVAYDMPRSYNYVVGTAPFYIQYIVPSKDKSKDSLLYQLAYIEDGNEIAYNQLIKSLPQTESDFRPIIRRVAMLEKKDKKAYVPRLGFSHIFVKNEKLENKYELIEKRDDAKRWLDCAE